MRFATLALFTALLVLPTSAFAKGGGKASPGEVWAQLKTAQTDEKTDFSAILEIMTPGYQAQLAQFTMMAAGMSTRGDKARREELVKIMAKHGFSERQRVTPESFKALKDKAKFLSDVTAFAQSAKGMTPKVPVGELRSLEIKDDVATAEGTYRPRGKLKEKGRSTPVAFKRLEGLWYLDVASRRGRPRSGRGAGERPSEGKGSKLDEPGVNLQVPGQSLEKAARYLRVYGITVEIGPGVDANTQVDLRIKGSTLRKTLDLVAKAAKVAWTWDEKKKLATFVPAKK